MSEFYQISSEDTAFDTMDESVLVINLRTAKYFHLTEVGAKIWSLIAEIKSISEIKSTLYSEYQISEEVLSAEVERFVAQLLNESLIVPVDCLPPSNFAMPQSSGAKKFESPMLETFTDLQEFLLLDPVHEISNLGLPQGKTLE